MNYCRGSLFLIFWLLQSQFVLNLFLKSNETSYKAHKVPKIYEKKIGKKIISKVYNDDVIFWCCCCHGNQLTELTQMFLILKTLCLLTLVCWSSSKGKSHEMSAFCKRSWVIKIWKLSTQSFQLFQFQKKSVCYKCQSQSFQLFQFQKKIVRYKCQNWWNV